MDDRLEAAVRVLVDRQARRAHPAGRFDDGGRWWPAAEERRPCCEGVRTPSRQWPYSLLLHCRTARHVAALCGVDESALRAAARAARMQAETAVSA